jgi:uncharacterized membrane protein YgcG
MGGGATGGNATGGGASGSQQLYQLNPDAPAFNMDAMAAAAVAAASAMPSRDARLPDFSLDKPEVWFSMVEACFEDCNIMNEKQRYNKVLYRLPVAVVESMAALVANIGDFAGREYQELKRRVLAAHGRSRWEKLDSLLAFPKMGANERPSVVLSRLNSLKPATLEELYMAIFLRVLPDSYREHFAHTELRTAEEMAAKADGLWEMRGGAAAATVAAITRPASPRRPSPGRQQDGGGGGGGRRNNSNRGRGGGRSRGNGGRNGGQRRDRSPTPGGALGQADGGGYATADGGNLHDGAYKGTGLCFHHFSYGRQATRCKPPCLFSQGNGAAAGSN